MTSPHQPNEIWFPAKRYGWGWGLPVRWQGWVVMLIWLGGVIACAILFAGSGRWVLYGVSIVALSVELIAICWWKGEKPRWRWGD